MSAFPINLKYRRLDDQGDWVMPNAGTPYHENSPAAVAQAVRTRLLLFTGEWFLNIDDGTPWVTGVLGTGTRNTYDQVIKDRIVNTPGVTEITSYSSSVDPAQRTLTVNATVNTAFGGQVSLSVPITPGGGAPPLTSPVSAPAQNLPSIRYRKLDENGDYTLTNTGGDYLVSDAAAIRQIIQTRLALLKGEWYLNTADGTQWFGGVLGKSNKPTADALLKERVLNSPGVTAITSWSSTIDPATRSLSVNTSVSTIYGPLTVSAVL